MKFNERVGDFATVQDHRRREERLNQHDQRRPQPGRSKPCSHTQCILALIRTQPTPERARFSYRTDPCCGHVATSHAFETSQRPGKHAVTAGIAHSNPIASHRIRHASGFLQTTLSKVLRQTTKPLPAPARGSPDRVLTFIGSYPLSVRKPDFEGSSTVTRPVRRSYHQFGSPDRWQVLWATILPPMIAVTNLGPGIEILHRSIS